MFGGVNLVSCSFCVQTTIAPEDNWEVMSRQSKFELPCLSMKNDVLNWCASAASSSPTFSHQALQQCISRPEISVVAISRVKKEAERAA